MLPIMKLELALVAYFSKSVRRRRRKRALRDALAAFASEHGRWVDALFDYHFLCTRGAEALSARDAEALARAWTQQFRYRDETQCDYDARRILPVAQTFLELFCRANESYTREMMHSLQCMSDDNEIQLHRTAGLPRNE